MRQTLYIMGTHITVEVRDRPTEKIFKRIFNYFNHVDEVFSVYRPDSEISKINRGDIKPEDSSQEVRDVFSMAEDTKSQTGGFFNIKTSKDTLDPSGIVKGWAIWQASKILESENRKYFFIDAGGDIQASLPTQETENWTVGIRNPFNKEEIIKVLKISNQGVATSGTYERGQHIYDPFKPGQPIEDIMSLTVIGKDIYEADRFATAAFAMGKKGIEFIEKIPGLEGYMVDKDGIATYTNGFNNYVL